MSAWGTFCRNFWRRVGLIARACLAKEGIAFVALMVSLLGAGVLSLMLWENLRFFRTMKSVDQLFYLSCGMLALIGIVFMSSHRLLGSSLKFDVEFWKLKAGFQQGDDTPDAPSPKEPVQPPPSGERPENMV